MLSTWNGQRYLDEQLESLAAQTLVPHELVVRDDASTDGSVELLHRFADRARFPVTVERGQERVGPARSFERALGAVSGDLVALCDQDDVWRPDKLAVLVRVLEDDPTVTLAFSDARLIDDDGRRIDGSVSRYLGLTGARRRRFDTDPLTTLLERSLVTGCTTVVRSRVVAAALPLPSSLDLDEVPMLHDRWLGLLAATLGSVVLIDQPLVDYRQHPAQHTGFERSALCRARAAVVGGASQLGRSATKGDALTGWRARLAGRSTQLEDVAERARAHGATARSVDLLRQAAQHLRTRADLPAARRRRLLEISRELRTGAYRWSDGSLAAAVDLVRG